MERMRKSASDRREEIVAATAALLLEQGINATATRDVTRRVGVGAGLLNHYFTWSELTAEALERALAEDIDVTIPQAHGQACQRAVERFLSRAFAPGADAVWRLWIEAMDAAISNDAIAAVLRRSSNVLHQRLEGLFREGTEADLWHCTDPGGAALRVMAMHDGLVGFVLAGSPKVSRAAAREHLRRHIAHECQRR